MWRMIGERRRGSGIIKGEIDRLGGFDRDDLGSIASIWSIRMLSCARKSLLKDFAVRIL
jgi:hypothetical protein